MKHKFIINYFFAIAIFFLSSSYANANQIRNLTILTESNLASVLTKIARVYSQKNGVIVSIGFASAASLINDIDSGEPADVFISANQDWVADLKQKGVIDIHTITHIASDRLVLATSKENLLVPKILENRDFKIAYALEMLNQRHSNIVIENEETSLGKYSKNIVSSLDLSGSKLITKSLEDKSSIFNLIEKNNDSYAILFESQAIHSKKVKIISVDKDSQIFYQALVVAGENMDVAREFLKFLKTKNAKSFFKESGFIID